MWFKKKIDFEKRCVCVCVREISKNAKKFKNLHKKKLCAMNFHPLWKKLKLFDQ